MTSRKPTTSADGNSVITRAYTSPTLVLLAMDWPEGARRNDFLGFAILRAPGFDAGERDGYLLNKIGFQPLGPQSAPMPSNIAPIQKFLWWDSAITAADRGHSFRYTVTPVCGTGAADLKLQHGCETTMDVEVPNVHRDGISTWFNRAVVSSQAFSREFPDPTKEIDLCMEWLANGMGDAFADILGGASPIKGAIYHITDKKWVLPAFEAHRGKSQIVYEARKNDQTDGPAIRILRSDKFVGEPRTKTNIMHDKFLVDMKAGRVLMGSANFTPEGITSQANLLHIIDAPELADLYARRHDLMVKDLTIGETAKQDLNWSQPIEVGGASMRVFFSPEQTSERKSIDTVIDTIKKAKHSVAFCMFDPTDKQLLEALLATGDESKLLYGMLNSISDPNKSKKKKSENFSASGEPPRAPSAATQIKVTLFNRSRKDKKVLAYSYFAKGRAPAGFLPEFSSVDFSKYSTYKPAKTGKKTFAPAVHIHHKFIIIDAETDTPTIYTGWANLSNNSTHRNDENLLEITKCPGLAQTYFAEFMRLYEHYRARALWNMAHPAGKTGAGTRAVGGFTLKTKRDDWVRGAYKKETPEYLARTTLSAT